VIKGGTDVGGVKILKMKMNVVVEIRRLHIHGETNIRFYTRVNYLILLIQH
jgi:hypothetical protein